MNLTNSDLFFFVVVRWIESGLARVFRLWDPGRNLPFSLILAKDVVAPGFRRLSHRRVSSLRPSSFTTDSARLMFQTMWTRCRVVRLRAASSEPDHPTKHTRAEVWTNKGIHVTTMKNSDGQPWCFVSSFFDEMCIEVSAGHQATCQTARDAGCQDCKSSLPQNAS